ncbi:hypothetical protein SAPIO_CDS4339 [Scedosporium apiospermum]|uniref:Uncharacterized protein n=1 Tax=Pseudallescheria apiosperma TaxID=563466 RepID=A0A084G8Q4_PSEDA|nr:uncharacterized protein SAPIO_CDS4339 [Scedosporium apiospermum]KEZ43716.1 hypothetical protein SAPIO_CDS4339 [Scedosporium apiospermum]
MKRRSPGPRSRPKDTLRGLASLLLLGYRTVRTNAQNKGRGVQPIHEGEGDINIFNVPGDFNDFLDFRWNDHAYTNNRNSGGARSISDEDSEEGYESSEERRGTLEGTTRNPGRTISTLKEPI